MKNRPLEELEIIMMQVKQAIIDLGNGDIGQQKIASCSGQGLEHTV